VNQLIGLLNHDGDARSRLTEGVRTGPVSPDTARCRAQRLPRRIPRACTAFWPIEPPSPELLYRVLEGLKRL
jgi:hypothetical protein